MDRDTISRIIARQLVEEIDPEGLPDVPEEIPPDLLERWTQQTRYTAAEIVRMYQGLRHAIEERKRTHHQH